jgi:hypothetical protein
MPGECRLLVVPARMTSTLQLPSAFPVVLAGEVVNLDDLNGFQPLHAE